MPDMIGGVTVPSIAASGTFPLPVDYPVITERNPPVKIHRFLGGNAKREQRFYLGTGARKWQITLTLSLGELDTLKAFYEDHLGSKIPFTILIPKEDRTTESVTAEFENEPLLYDMESGILTLVKINLVESNLGDGPTYSLVDTVTRFPNSSLNTALAAQAQTWIKLVKIKPRKVGYDSIYLSDRRCTIGGQLYQARVLRWDGIGQVGIGVPGVSAQSDDVSITLGNADRVMRMLADDVQLDRARIECSLFNVDTGIKLDLWAGEIVPGGWQSNSGPEFGILCSDIVASPFVVFPPDIIDRKCIKAYDDGIECPYASVGSLNPDYPSADATFCDKGFTTDNGCQAHNMDLYFGGIIATPQGVNVKIDNGFWGFGKKFISSFSIVADSVYGQPVPIVVTDRQFPVNAKIIAGRDESQFYRALGIVARGPIVLAPIGSTLDGQYHHSYPDPNTGIRTIPGTDPVTPPGPGYTGDVMALYPFQAPLAYSAGIAALEILRTDEAGLQLTQPTSHSMVALVDEGLHGWVWDAAHTRSKVVLTNPVWFCVNAFLLSKRLWSADAATQEFYLDLDSIVAAASICDLVVARVVEVDQGNETQFKCIGIVQDQRQLSQWMNDILANCLGYFTWSFGRLRIGIRENSSTVSAYTDGNIIMDSLKVLPLGPSFTKLICSFADSEYGFINNTATFQDDDYATEIGDGLRAVHEPAELRLSLTADISQAQRIATTRGREEVGGVTQEERTAARKVTFKTTILGLDTDPGMVISITDPEMPGGGPAEFRVQSWKLLDDYSVEITARASTDSMYNLVMGPKPADVGAGGVPPELFPTPLKQALFPNEVAYAAAPTPDANAELTFRVGLQPTALPDGTIQVEVEALTKLPVNAFIPGVSPPTIHSHSVNSTGGSLKGDKDYWIAVCARDANNQFTPHSNIVAVHTPAGTDTCSISLDSFTWPDGTYAGCDLFVGMDSQTLMCFQGGFDGALPSTIAIDGPMKFRTWNLPSVANKTIRAKVKILTGNGPLGVPITSTTSSTIVCGSQAGKGDDWTGRTIRVVPGFLNPKAAEQTGAYVFHCTAWDDSTGTYTVDTAVPDWITADDFLTVDYIADIIEARRIGDTKNVCGQSPGGTDVDADVGRVIIHYADIDQPAKIYPIISNDQVSWTTDRDFDPPVNANSFWYIADKVWSHPVELSPGDTLTNDQEGKLTISVLDLQQRSVLVGLFMVDAKGNETDEGSIPMRPLFIEGAPSTFIINDKATWGLDDDVLVDFGFGLGINAVNKFGNVHSPGTPFVGSISWTGAPTLDDFKADILFSRDGGITWNSIFSTFNPYIIIAKNTPSGIQFITNFAGGADVDLIEGDLLRLDMIQSGGATGIEIVIKWGYFQGQISGTSGTLDGASVAPPVN